MPSTHSQIGSKRRFSTLAPIPENPFEPPSPSSPPLPHLPRGHSLDYELPSILESLRQQYGQAIPPHSPPDSISSQGGQPPLKRQKRIDFGRYIRNAQPGDAIVIPAQAFKQYFSYEITLEDTIYEDAEGVKWQAVAIKHPWIFRNLVPDYQRRNQPEALEIQGEDPPVSPRTMGPETYTAMRWCETEREDSPGIKNDARLSYGCSAADLVRDLEGEVEAMWDANEDLMHPFYPGFRAMYAGRSISVA